MATLPLGIIIILLAPQPKMFDLQHKHDIRQLVERPEAPRDNPRLYKQNGDHLDRNVNAPDNRYSLPVIPGDEPWDGLAPGDCGYKPKTVWEAAVPVKGPCPPGKRNK